MVAGEPGGQGNHGGRGIMVVGEPGKQLDPGWQGNQGGRGTRVAGEPGWQGNQGGSWNFSEWVMQHEKYILDLFIALGR